MKSYFWTPLLAGMLLFSGCRSTAPTAPPALPFQLSEAYSITSAASREIQGKWWESFESQELQGLVNQALQGSFDLKVLQARIDQARASREKANAAFFPFLNYSGGGKKQHTRVKRSSSADAVTDGSHSWDASLSGGFTPDLWGSRQADYDAGEFSHQAAILDLSQARLELSAQVAQTWVDLIAARQRKELLQDQIKTNNSLLSLLKLRFVNGQADALDVSQQQESLAQAEAQQPVLERQIRVLHNNMALLCGLPSRESVSVKTQTLPETAPDFSAGIPSDLLKRRPDIQAAGMRVFSARKTWESAKTDFFPDFSLTAQALFSSGKLDLLFQNWVASLTAAVAGPLFDGGQIKAETRRTRAVMEERLQQYASAVASAVIEVENQLVTIEKQEDYISLLQKELSIARVTLKDARVQYMNGSSTFLNYLVTWNGIQQLEQQLISEQATLMKESISLMKALGWPDKIAPQQEEINEH